MGDIATCAEVRSQGSFATECNFQAFFTLWFGAACLERFDRNESRSVSMSRDVSITLDTVCQETTTNRMSNMPTIPYQTLSGTFAPRRIVVNAAA
jgi:hypothetical protein